MVPGAACAESVTPIMARATVMASRPSHTMATTGPEVMNSARLSKNGLPMCSA